MEPALNQMAMAIRWRHTTEGEKRNLCKSTSLILYCLLLFIFSCNNLLLSCQVWPVIFVPRQIFLQVLSADEAFAGESEGFLDFFVRTERVLAPNDAQVAFDSGLVENVNVVVLLEAPLVDNLKNRVFRCFRTEKGV